MFVPRRGLSHAISVSWEILKWNPLSASHPDLKSMNLWPISCTRAFWRYELLFSGSPWTWSNRRRNSRKALQPKIDPQSRSWRKSPAKLSVSRSMSLDPTLRYLHRITTWRNCEDFLIDGVAQPTSQEQILNDYKKNTRAIHCSCRDSEAPSNIWQGKALQPVQASTVRTNQAAKNVQMI